MGWIQSKENAYKFYSQIMMMMKMLNFFFVNGNTWILNYQRPTDYEAMSRGSTTYKVKQMTKRDSVRLIK